MKKIFVIGNGTVNEDFSEAIDTSDVVVRFNNLDNYNLNTGTKIDIWVHSSNKTLLQRLIDNPKQIESKTKLKLRDSILSISQIIFTIPIFFPIKADSVIAQERNERRMAVIEFLKYYSLLEHPFKLIEFPTNYLLDLNPQKWFSEYQYPSNGYLFTRYLVDSLRYSEHQIILVGFSWEGWAGHPWKFEKKYLQKMELNKIIEILK